MHMHRHTHTRNDYCNPYACALRLNDAMIYLITIQYHVVSRHW